MTAVGPYIFVKPSPAQYKHVESKQLQKYSLIRHRDHLNWPEGGL